MNCRISLQKSAWSCETNMSSAIDQATRSTTHAGASSRSSCERPRDFRPSASFPRLVITPPATEFSGGFLPSLRYVSVLICAAAILASAAFPQIPIPNSVPPPPSQDPDAGKQGPSIKVDVNLVVLRSEEHTSELQSPCNIVCRLLLEKIIFLNPQCLASISRWITASSSWKRFCLFVCSFFF